MATPLPYSSRLKTRSPTVERSGVSERSAVLSVFLTSDDPRSRRTSCPGGLGLAVGVLVTVCFH